MKSLTKFSPRKLVKKITVKKKTADYKSIDRNVMPLCFCNCYKGMNRTVEEINQQKLHQKFLIHVLGTIIMGADVTLDIMQVVDYGRYGDKTRDLFIASLVIMSIVPAGLAFGSAFCVTYREIRMIFDFFDGKDNFQWGFFLGMCLWCVIGMITPLVIVTFLVTLALSFPLMMVGIVLTPAYGLYVAWKNIEARNKLRLFYFIRYTEGLVCAFPHFVINVIFMHRMGAHSTQAVSSAIFSGLAICQVFYQAFGLKRYICRCKPETCMSLDGIGTYSDILEWNTGNTETSILTATS